MRDSSKFEVIDRNRTSEASYEVGEISHGEFDTLDEARGCVTFDKLTDYEIWQGDHIVEEAGDRDGVPVRACE